MDRESQQGETEDFKNHWIPHFLEPINRPRAVLEPMYFFLDDPERNYFLKRL